MTPQTISGWVKDPEARKRYVEAFERSDFTAMLNYYKANYPRVKPGDPAPAPSRPERSAEAASSATTESSAETA